MRDREVVVEIPEIAPSECPLSLLSRYPAVEALLTEIRRAEIVKDATGAVPYGPDTTKWPTRWHDAVELSRIEESRIDAAVDKVFDQMRS